MESWFGLNGSQRELRIRRGLRYIRLWPRGFSLAVATAPGAAPAKSRDAQSHRKSRRCRIDVLIGKTLIDGIVDTGASGGNCLDKSVFNSLPVDKYRIISFKPSVCMGINKTPVRVLGRILLDIRFKSPGNKESNPLRLFREEFHIIENLIHPIVFGLPFLQKHRATLSFERGLLFIGTDEIPMAQAPPMTELPPPHLAAFQSCTIPAFSRSCVNVYLTGNSGMFEAETTESLYVRPFYSKCSKDVPQVAAHTVVDPRNKVMVVEVINSWPSPIEIATTRLSRW